MTASDRPPAGSLPMPRGTLMIQGTTSDAGKSTLVAGLCRLARRAGARVAPFKPQNMALNSAVTADGGEIGRAQALQAIAAGIEAHTDLNPVLLKPTSDRGSQVIIHGHAHANLDARAYHAFKPAAFEAVLASYARLRAGYDAVIVEGAGSPAEINLREGDIANMGFAERVDCPVVLVADIDRGGVFAHLLGTLACLSDSERARVRGFVINRFRGDPALLEPGLDWLEQRTGKPVLGVVPYLLGLALDAEDMLPSLAHTRASDRAASVLRVVVPALPRISNHTDYDALRAHPRVDFSYWKHGPIPPADLVILPGSKVPARSRMAARARLGGGAQAPPALRRQGDRDLRRNADAGSHARRSARPGRRARARGRLRAARFRHHPDAAEDAPQRERAARLGAGAAVAGYEIHMGETRGPALAAPALLLDGPQGTRPDGARSADGQILATYVHGVFERPDACAALLEWAGLDAAEAVDWAALREASIERLADTLGVHLDLDRTFGAFA